jgi:hypothetical protein
MSNGICAIIPVTRGVGRGADPNRIEDEDGGTGHAIPPVDGGWAQRLGPKDE